MAQLNFNGPELIFAKFGEVFKILSGRKVSGTGNGVRWHPMFRAGDAKLVK